MDYEESFAAFFVAHRGGLERFVRWRVGTSEVDDLCAEVFVVALRRFDEIRDLPQSTARGWLLRVATYRCSNVHRSRWRRDRAYRRVAVDPDLDAYDPFDDMHLEQLTDDGALTERAREVLAALPQSHRAVLRLELDGPITGKEMAAALGTTEVAGRLRLMRAKRAFAAEYTRRFGSPTANEIEGGGS